VMERHKEKYLKLKKDTEKLLKEKDFEYFTGDLCITFWIKLPVKDTYKWIDQHAIRRHSLAAVPGAFFLFGNDYELMKSNRIRLGVGSLNPDKPQLPEAFEIFERAVKIAH